MSRKEELEKLILDSYEIIHENNQKILGVDPSDRKRLRQQNDEKWEYIKSFLMDYTLLCEARRLTPLEEIIDIAAQFPDMVGRLEAASKARVIPLDPLSIVSTSTQKVDIPLFKIDYKFVYPNMPVDRDQLAQFVVRFGPSDETRIPYDNKVVTHICLVLDVSGSMNEEKKYPFLLKAIPSIIDSLQENDMLTLILFSSDSDLIWSGDIASTRHQQQDIKRRIEQSGVKFEDTFLAPGLRKAIDAVKHFYRVQPEAVTRVYVLTDGQIHDVEQCFPINSELRHLGLEINSYGFGQDFDEDTMRRIMDGCPGGRVKWVSNTEMIWKSFQHIGEVARNIVATNADLELGFFPNVTLGDAFRFEPGTHWFNAMDDRNKRFHVHVGALEKQRSYIYAFEARIYPSQVAQEQIATATLKYSFQGSQRLVTQNVLINRSHQPGLQAQVDPEIEKIFKVLEGLRSTDPQSKKESFEARLEILRRQGGDPAQIKLLERALEELSREGMLESFSDREIIQLNANIGSSQALPPNRRDFNEPWLP